ncbi:MAG: N-acetylneuraminate synthase family protein [Planctomycetota bacterium]|nr:N-acetylneuraminate synthase family protein [Planctomycetota bacterium]
MKIGRRLIDAGSEPYIIAEIGVNHDGDIDTALALVDAAAEAGADAVKTQIFTADLLMSVEARLAAYQAAAGERDPIEMLRRLELPLDAMDRIIKRAHSRGMHAIATVFSVDLVDGAARQPWDAFKTASPDIIHQPLIDALLRTDRPLLLSTGAADAAEVERAASWCAGREVGFFHCVSAYPTPDDDAALAGIRVVGSLVDAPVGYSDHTTSLDTGALAVAAGACMLEKHLTLDRSLPGPDHAASLDPEGFAAYVQAARRAHRMAGPSHKRPSQVERDVRDASRQSIVARRDLPAGHVLKATDLAIKRPGRGIPPFRLNDLVGCTLRRSVAADHLLTEAHFDASADQPLESVAR